jgi:hypothetical protein
MPDLFNANDGTAGRDGGPYLDQVEARHAEDARAIIEGRKPDYSTMAGTAGTVYLTAAQMFPDKTPEEADKIAAALVADESSPFRVAFSAPDVPEVAEPVVEPVVEVEPEEKKKETPVVTVKGK